MFCRTSLLLMWALLALPALAQVTPPPLQATAAAQVPPGTDSEKAHILALLVKGDIEGAISYWGVAHAGQQVPAWLLALRTSYEASKQVAGQCQTVARGIHTAFTQLGGKPQFVELTARQGDRTAFMVYRIDSGKDLMMSDNGYHVAVRIANRAYDAYAGPQGLPWTAYMERVGSVLKVEERVIKALPD
jgi:hypothetical protein